MGAVSYLRCDPVRNGRPVYSIKFDELNTRGGRLGIFQTGLYRVANIKNFRIKLFDYSADDTCPLKNQRFERNLRNLVFSEEMFTDLLKRIE